MFELINRPGARTSSRLMLTALAALALGLPLMRRARAHPGFRASHPALTSRPQAAPPAAAWIGVAIDPQETIPSDSAALDDALLGSGGTGTTATASVNRPWYLWGHLSAPRARARFALPDSQAPSAAGAYAVRFATGAAVLIANRTGVQARARVRIHLVPGIYLIQRLSLSPVSPIGPTAAVEKAIPVSEPHSNPAHDQGPRGGALVRDAVLRLAHRAQVTRVCWIPAGGVAILRFTDEGKEARLALAETMQLLGKLARTAPGPARRLRRMLNEGAPYADALYPEYGRGASRQVESIHRLLLVTDQAQSLHRNYQMRGNVSGQDAAQLMGALERLTDSLAETSAALLGLVPSIQVKSADVSSSGARTPASGADGQNSVTHTAAIPSEVVVSLRNEGGSSVAMVKLGLDGAALPQGVTCDPADPAFFGALRPGQTAQATFQLHSRSGVGLTSDRCVADVSYFAGSAPAHLRPRAW